MYWFFGLCDCLILPLLVPVGPSEDQRLLKKMHCVGQALSLGWMWLQKNVTLCLSFFIMPRILCITRLSYECILITVLAAFVNSLSAQRQCYVEV
jgi:hypothetical protein